MLQWFSKSSILYYLVFAFIWLLWELFKDELASLIRERIPEGGMITYALTHPAIIMPSVLIVSFLILLIRHIRKAKPRSNQVPKDSGFHFEFNDSSITTKYGKIQLGVNYLPSSKVTIETLQLEYNNERFRPDDWQPIQIEHSHTKNYMFDLNGLKAIADETSQEAVFIAKVNGEEIRSHPFNIYKLFGSAN